MKVGDIVIAKITSIVGYGAFVTVDDYAGLIHISEFSDHFVRNIADFVKVGEEIRARVLDIDEDNKRVKLSYKSLHKTRGVKCKVPEYKIGFKTLENSLDTFIEEYKEEKEWEKN